MRLVIGSPRNDSLYSVDMRSGGRWLLAHMPGADFIERIRWSPDGAHIAVQIREDDAGSLYVLGADGSDIRKVADDSDSLGFAWSPDGTRLAFGSEEGEQVKIQVTTVDGAAHTQLGTVHPDFCAKTSWGGDVECSVTWSPDGTQVAFRIEETGDVTAFDAAGTGEPAPLDELTFLSWDGGWYEAPVWKVP
jgi:Tol biopolymer transport system component